MNLDHFGSLCICNQFFKDYPAYGGDNSEYLFKYGLCLPSGSNLSDEDLSRIINKIKEAFEK